MHQRRARHSWNNHRVLGKYGHNLATDLVNRGGSSTNFHDSIMLTLSDFLHEANDHHQLEPRGLLLGCVTPLAESWCRFVASTVSTSTLATDLAIQELPGTPASRDQRPSEATTIAQWALRKKLCLSSAAVRLLSPDDKRQDAIHSEAVAHVNFADVHSVTSRVMPQRAPAETRWPATASFSACRRQLSGDQESCPPYHTA